VRERVCHGGPLDGERVPRSRVRGAFAWLDAVGRAYGAPGDGRALYLVDGEALAFAGHGVRRCAGCGGLIDADPDTGAKISACPLCGAVH
jgi:hypothetical protein